MRVNLFEGFRRIFWLLLIAWLATVAWITYESSPYVSMTFSVYGPGSIPTRYYSPCGPNDATDYRRMFSTLGKSVGVNFCFLAHKANDGRMLVPVKVDGDMWMMNDKFSAEVSNYKDIAIVIERANHLSRH